MKTKTIMSAESYRLNVGDFECTIVKDGTIAYPYPAKDVFINFFVNAPEEGLKRVLGEHNLDPERWEQYVSPYSALLINTGQRRVLVDTGAGSFAPTTGRLIPNLQAEGISPGDIDTVILTHCHLDHIGGALDIQGKPAFPKARYVMWRDEWDFWTTEKAAEAVAELKIENEHLKEGLVAFPLHNLPPIQDQLDLVDHETEIVPGIRAVAAPGHTPGHMAVAVVSGNERLLYISDTVLHPIHLEQPRWCSAVAIAPEEVVTTRRRLLNRAEAEKAIVFASHFPFPGLGHVVQKEKGWQWKPIKT